MTGMTGMTANTSRRQRAFRLAFGLAGVTFLAVALWETWDRSRPPVMPHWSAWLTAFAAVLAAMAAAARGWATLFEGAGSIRRLAHGLYVAHFGKHIPGGVWQVVGQIGLAVGPGVSAAKAATAFPVMVVVQVVGGLSVGALLGFSAGTAPGWVRVLAVCGLATLPLLRREWMTAVAARIRKWRRLEEDDHLPSQAAILRCYGWTLVTFLFSGLAFALLLRSLSDAGVGIVPAIGAFGVAWVVGFLAVPFPSGIGVREGVMVVLVGPVAAQVIAASVLHRLVTMVAEGVLAAVTWRPE